MLSKFANQSVKKSSIFLPKASFEKNLLKKVQKQILDVHMVTGTKIGNTCI